MAEPVTLRPWQDSDLGPFSRMNADPEVMRWYPAPLSAAESAALMGRLRAAVDRDGWGLWAAEVDGRFAGYTGLSVPAFEAAFMPCVEIGWRFAREYWGRSLAYAAAQQAEAVAFCTLKLPELVTFTAASNARSIRLMERLRFARDPRGDFLHPRLPEGHPLKPHVLYRKDRAAFSAEPR